MQIALPDVLIPIVTLILGICLASIVYQMVSRARSKTFEQDIEDEDVLAAVLLDLTEQVAIRLRRHDRYAQRVQIKVRFAGFHTITRRKKEVISIPPGF